MTTTTPAPRPPAPAPAAHPPPPCRSCAMPLRSDAERGTEADGSARGGYHRHCYGDGAFTDPDLPLDRQTTRLAALAVQRGTPEGDAREAAERALVGLGRWGEREVGN